MIKALKEVIDYIKKYPILLIILIFAWIVNLSFFYPIEINLGHDVYWHLALVEVAFNKIPFQNPSFSGIPLQGYNYLIDLIMFFITKLGISSIHVYFIIMPLVYVFSMSFLSILFAKRHNRSIYFVASFVFFMFCASPFSYLLAYYRRGDIFAGFHYPTAAQSPAALTNFSYAFSLLIILIALIIFQKKKIRVREVIMLCLLAGLNFGLKFYGGVILLFMVAWHFFTIWLSERNLIKFIFSYFLLGLLISVTVIFFYNPFSSVKTGGIFAVYPFAIANNLIEDPNALYVPQLVMPRYTLLAANKFSPRLILIEMITLAIYLVYNFGTRIIGWFYLIKQTFRRKLNHLEINLLLTIIFSIILTTLLIQKGGDWWNTVQFFGYGLVLANFFAAGFINDLFKSNKFRAILITIIIIVLTLPLSIELIINVKERLGNRNGIYQQEVKALTFLREQKDGAVFALPILSKVSSLPARSGKPVYYADENVLSNLGVDYERRKKQLMDLNNLNLDQINVKYFFLIKNDKDYDVILDKVRKLKTAKVIYDDPEVIIFEKTVFKDL